MYQHTQQSPLHFLLYIPAIILFCAAWQLPANEPPRIGVALLAGVFAILALSFYRLTVRGTEEWLEVQYGPINWFGTRILYADITDVQPGQTSWIDGWGIHFIPFRGWTINLWGFECVKIGRGKKTIRIGTDDSENLTAFLRQRCGERAKRSDEITAKTDSEFAA